MLILVLTFLLVLGALTWRFLRTPSAALAYLLSAYVLLMLRSFSETLMQPLSPYCALIFCCGVVALRVGRTPSPAARTAQMRLFARPAPLRRAPGAPAPSAAEL